MNGLYFSRCGRQWLQSVWLRVRRQQSPVNEPVEQYFLYLLQDSINSG